MIPYGRQSIDEDDIRAVAEVLRSDWLTTGPAVDAFEAAVAAFAGAAHGVALSSGTAALHAMMHVAGIGPGDEVVVPAMTFAATANAVCYLGGTPVFADVDPRTLLLDPADVERKLTPRTKAVVAVDYAGQPCDYEALAALCRQRGVALFADACHALGATQDGRPLGALPPAMTALSFHPVKHIATGEGGMVLTSDEQTARLLRRFRNHGIDTDARQREATGAWHYNMVELGFNYRISDIQCALGLSQLRRLPDFLARRRAIARFYAQALRGIPVAEPLAQRPGAEHAWHLYVVRLAEGIDRRAVFTALREQGIGVNVHYIPVHLHPYYRERFGHGPGLCPEAEAAYESILTLPMHQGLTDEQAARVMEALAHAL
ncbi:UDP-4-amino-4-deoxy-L-arabinose--oxoglutarate aminotransferase [Fundidesulfovibrio magnetotacticus]|uniref:UDP-4-amino-4-deoxy-L-arabinose--oxoglutarate aminotransferase n=1 Tax=Fundidesulfovibrio magnetotacticus TaxID=2730080 RepID=A0A6V8LT19_9BACT|nr:UDP-4-amino-4,6-dideoxy-N-acetyl-beta-L-altrosamine transaminase [Fundidesulfovibrio magnetotacticus]GFK94864.1 UDP-4-amino-4-deoxy-L-arabinose--oxoglutarate aminotransferase [Fundidesulfovibrio magnetotacticus]